MARARSAYDGGVPTTAYRPRGTLPPHGTRARYRRELYRGGCREACCRDANTDYQREYRAKTQAVRIHLERTRAGALRPGPWSEPQLFGG